MSTFALGWLRRLLEHGIQQQEVSVPEGQPLQHRVREELSVREAEADLEARLDALRAELRAQTREDKDKTEDT